MDKAFDLIDQFVARLNDEGLEPLFDDAVPPDLRTKRVSDVSEIYGWQIRSAEFNSWAVELEQRLPFKLPTLYHDLIMRYRFAEFTVGPILFLANTGVAVFNELGRVIFRDDDLSPKLLKSGLLQFGRAAGGSFDPVCFDMTRRVSGDAPLVRIDHEDVLTRSKVRVMDEIAPRFRYFVEQAVVGRYSTL